MKKILNISLALVALVSTSGALAQDDKSKRPSPPATLTTSINGTDITINYSQPAVKGRTLGKDIAPYGEVWRTGANEATTFETSKDVTIEGRALKAGKYALFTIPGEKEWTIIFNSVPAQWGAYKYEQNKDVLRVTVPAGKAKDFTERLTFSANNNNIAMAWANTQVQFKVE
jgi:hypothetical protein